MEEEANLILTASVIDNRTSGQAIKGVGTILSELKADGKIENYGDIDGDVAVTGIQFDVNSVTLGVGDNSGTLIATFLPENPAGGYYVVVKGKKYQVSKVNEKIEIGKTEITTEGSSNRKIDSVGTTDSSVATAEKVGDDGIRITGVAAGGPVTITVEYSENITTTISVTVKAKYTVTAEVYSEDSAKGSVFISPVSSDYKYVEGSTVTLTATANTGYQLEGWYNGEAKLSEENPYSYIVPAANATITAKFKIYEKYGKTVNLGTVEVNGTALLQGWKYFYEDEVANGNIYLIYESYLENAQIPIPSGKGIEKNGYNVCASSGTRERLVAYLRGVSTTAETTNLDFSGTWEEFAKGVETALNAKLEEEKKLTVGMVKAYGAPTVEQFQESYNENYPEDEFRIKYVMDLDNTYKDDTTSTTKASAVGYVYKKKNVDWHTSALLGKDNKLLYFPVTIQTKETSAQTNYTSGYWLARLLS